MNVLPVGCVGLHADGFIGLCANPQVEDSNLLVVILLDWWNGGPYAFDSSLSAFMYNISVVIVASLEYLICAQ